MKSRFKLLGTIALAIMTVNFVDAQIYTPSGIIQGPSGNNNIGIGTSSPRYPLDIFEASGRINTIRLNSAPNANPNVAFAIENSYVANIRFYDARDLFQIQIGSPLKTAMSINKDLNIGIGTDDPRHPLTVYKKPGKVNNVLLDAAPGESPNMAFAINGLGGANIRLLNDADLKHPLQFLVNPFGLVAMTITNTGKVGIGTTTPDHKLEVNGTIKCEEVMVNNVAADFVFENNYHLIPLKDVEKFIEANGHLPDIAPAIETEKGIKLSEFNTILLQKIEELTLYTIQQQKQIEALQSEIKEVN